jgi:NAD(P)-dependent dehydrogenase (short-subunit alcohol dehydrogenase family)
MMLDGKTILVTGATSGIGESLCQELAVAGVRVIAIGRNEAKLADLRELSPNVQAVTLDVTDFSSYPAVLANVDQLDGVVCSAGIYEANLMRYFSVEKHDEVMRTNLTAPLALINELARLRKLNIGASIVFVSSILGPVTGLIGGVSYASSKAALVACAKTLALELARYSIRVNCVSPGMVETAMTSGLGYTSPESSKADKAKYPLGRYATPGEVTSAIRYLLSSEASFITGTNLIIDGGCSAQ